MTDYNPDGFEATLCPANTNIKRFRVPSALDQKPEPPPPSTQTDAQLSLAEEERRFKQWRQGTGDGGEKESLFPDLNGPDQTEQRLDRLFRGDSGGNSSKQVNDGNTRGGQHHYKSSLPGRSSQVTRNTPTQPTAQASSNAYVPPSSKGASSATGRGK
jgi:hypothetical protein